MRAHDAELRRVLESDWPLLEATRLRYRALRNVLSAWLWRGRFRRNADLVSEVIRAQTAVSAALSRATERARAEKWHRGEVTRLLAELRKLTEQLERLVAHRLGEPPGSLAEQLASLETAVLREAYRVKAPRRRVAAREMLPLTLPALAAATDAARPLEAFAKSPLGAPAAPAVALAEALEATASHLDEAWTRVAQTDAGGSVQRFLERRSRRLSLRPAKDGPDLLMRATFWLRTARARLRQELAHALPGMALSDTELPGVVAWLWGDAPLSVDFPSPRRGALELARALAAARGAPDLLKTWPKDRWERLQRAAASAAQDASAASLVNELALWWSEASWAHRRADLVSLVEAWRESARLPPSPARTAWRTRLRGIR